VFDRVYVMHPGPRDWPKTEGSWRGLRIGAERAGRTIEQQVPFGLIRTHPGGLKALLPYVIAELDVALK
jgi:hypothetical protein